MTTANPPEVRQLSANDIARMRDLLTVFAEAFDEAETYTANQPSDAYLRDLLASDTFIAVVAIENDQIIGGLTAYELKKFEQERREIYIYDLAVASRHRRKGVATGLIEELKSIAAKRRAYVIVVQADHTDSPAIALYSKLGVKEEVLHFDIEVAKI